MNQTEQNRSRFRRIPTRIGIAATALLCLGVLSAAPASANFEQVANFAGTPGVLKSAAKISSKEEEDWPEEVQLGGLGGMAVNYTGAGGVPKGTIYAATYGQGIVARYNPDGSFSERWSWNGTLGGATKERCGPEGDPAQPPCDRTPQGQWRAQDVDVDQSTGDVYVFNGEVSAAGKNVIHVYSPDGSQLLAEFGEKAPFGEAIAASPQKVHVADTAGGIAVNGAGDIYLFDEEGNSGNGSRRLMVYEPQSPGDYEHYVYAGQSHDIAQEIGFQQSRPVVDAAGNLFIADEAGNIAKLDPANPAAPALCKFAFPKGGIRAITVDPLSDELFFTTYKETTTIHRLGGECSEGKLHEVGQIQFSPARKEFSGLAFDPLRQFEAGRPAGVLYAGSAGGGGGKVVKEESGELLFESALGYIFSQPPETPPAIESESLSHLTASSALAQASVNPKGSATRYVFQYLPESAYQESEPDERQSLTVSATGGVFGLSFEGKRLGGDAMGNLTSGSKQLTALHTASGKADLSAAAGSGDLNGAKGQGTVSAGLALITGVSASSGSFAVGQGISGVGIPAGTTINAIQAEGVEHQRLTLSNPASESGVEESLSAGTAEVTSLTTSEGAFALGQQIKGPGIPSGTTIAALGASELTLSQPALGPATGVSLHAGSTKLDSLSTELGSFEAGEEIEGVGIPAGAKVLSLGAAMMTISEPVTKPGSAVSIFTPRPYPLAPGERIEGPGIPSGTTIVSLEDGKATLSKAATATATAVQLHAGVPADASAVQLRSALEGLATIGPGNLSVSGGPGDEAGSSPYEITFTGAFENQDVLALQADPANLSGGPASAAVATENDGGNGFSAGAMEAPVGGAFAGEGSEALSVAASLVGLQPDSAYRFRAVATSHCSQPHPEKVCATDGRPLALHTFPEESPGLPDYRAYELVSPPQKGSGEVIPADSSIGHCAESSNEFACKPGDLSNSFPRQSSPDGNSVIYQGGAFDSETSAVNENEYLARRDPQAGWQSANLTPVGLVKNLAGGLHSGYQQLSPGLGSAVLGQIGDPVLSPSAPPGYTNLYSQQTDDPLALTPLLGAAPPNRSASGFGQLELHLAGSSADGQHIFFDANDALTPETAFAPEALDGGASKFNLYEFHQGQIALVNVMPGNAATQPGASFAPGSANAISADGSRVFWSDESGQVYVREGAQATREIKTEGVPDPGKFLTASVDGSEVLLQNGHLHSLGDEEPTVDLTAGKGGFQGIAGQSEDLSHVYFVDTEVLDETPNESGEEAKAGEDNLYAWVGGKGTRFIATLLASDKGGNNLNSWAVLPSERNAEASPQGRYLAFLSKASLSGYDNVGLCEGNHHNGYVSAPCAEAFLYDSAAARLTCVSCNRSQASPLGRSNLRLIRAAPSSSAQPRYLTDAGRLLFDSQDSLVPADTNEGVEDVYEYEPGGVGSCKREAGCVSLISAGTGTVDSNFLAMDEAGDNVFFTTRDQLSLRDRDDLFDLYDARVDGGLPVETEVARTECQGEACQAPVSAPNDPTPGSASFEGAGNVSQGKAKKHAHHAKKRHRRHRARANRHHGGAK